MVEPDKAVDHGVMSSKKDGAEVCCDSIDL